MIMTAREIVEAGEEALRRANAPICYLHKTGKDKAFAAVVTIECLQDMIMLFGDQYETEAYDLFNNHGHIEGDEDDERDTEIS